MKAELVGDIVQEGDTTVRAFLDALASEQPTPGGGGVAALTVSLGAALVSMTARLTIGRRKYADVEDAMREVIERSELIRAEALGLIQDDSDAYGDLVKAFAMSGTTDAEKHTRRQALSASATKASLVPLRVGRLAAELIEIASVTVQVGNRNVISDAGAGAALARAAIRICEMNIDANRTLVTEPAANDQIECGLSVIRAARDEADLPVEWVLERD